MNKQDFIDLYLLCFTDDSHDDAEALWNMTPENRIIAIGAEGLPCSMMVLMDGKLVLGKEEYPLYYVYAACTHPQYRKQGKMGELIQLAYNKALNEGKKGLFLNPASESLVQYYASHGFKPFSGIKTETLPSSAHGIALRKLSVQDGIKCRNKVVENSFKRYIEWDPVVSQSALAYSKEAGGGAFTDSPDNPKVFILAEPKGGTLFVREAIGANVKNYIPGLAYSLGCQKAFIRLPSGTMDSCFGMLLSKDIPIQEAAYMGIALD